MRLRKEEGQGRVRKRDKMGWDGMWRNEGKDSDRDRVLLRIHGRMYACMCVFILLCAHIKPFSYTEDRETKWEGGRDREEEIGKERWGGRQRQRGRER